MFVKTVLIETHKGTDMFNPGKTFFTADEHYLNRGIIEYCNRPFQTPKHMTQELIRRHNEVVPQDGTVWHIGDVTLEGPHRADYIRRNIIQQLNGEHHLVLGNHDEWKVSSYLKDAFLTVHTAFWFVYERMVFYLGHDPSMYTILENTPNAYQLCGHIHTLFQDLLPKKRIINVGVDVWDYEPISLARVINLIRISKEIGK